MEKLPVEILEVVLSNNKLTIEDVLNFGTTCNQMNNVIKGNNVIWKKKFSLRWPSLYVLVESEITNWHEEVKYVYELKDRTRRLLSTMPPRFHTKVELSGPDFAEWPELLNERKFVYEYVIHDLISIVRSEQSIFSIQPVPVTTPGNKTLRYYARKVLRFLRQERLALDWNEFMSVPESERILEKGVTIVAQWFQPELHVYWKDIANAFDGIANEVKEHLYALNPKHPLFKVPQETLDRWKAANLSDNVWNSQECREILGAMKHVLYEKLGFIGNTSNYYMPQNSYINEVLDKKQGLPITLSILYESVARRLGLNCEPVSTPAHFLLRFAEGRAPHLSRYYIDVFNKGEVINPDIHCYRASAGANRLYPRATAQEVIERMANNLEIALRDHGQTNGGVTLMRSVLEFINTVNPQDLTTVVYLARLYMTYNLDTTKLETLLRSQAFKPSEQANRILNMLQGYAGTHNYNKVEFFDKTQPNRRTPEVKFAVGMVMKHLLFNYKCVICDWNTTCMATIDWQRQMKIERLKYKGDQPFYGVLVEDGSKRYVAQENLIPTADTGFLYLNDDIGRHFSHFFETHYVPNAEKEQEYPEDGAVRHKFYQEMLFGS